MKHTRQSSKAARVMAILQLCIAFTIIAGTIGYPFMGELCAYKSKTILYHIVMGDHSLAGSADTPLLKQYQESLNRNHERFNALPVPKQEAIINQYIKLQNPEDQSFMTKIDRGSKILAFELPAFERGWLLLSVVISILILWSIEGAAEAGWLLPVLAVCYIAVNRLDGEAPESLADAALFPQESYIVQKYLQKPLSDNILGQHAELKLGWQRYLITEWAFELPLEDPEVFNRQVEAGEFAFTVARLDKLAGQRSPSPFNVRKSWWLLGLYLCWNLLFVYVVSVKEEVKC